MLYFFLFTSLFGSIIGAIIGFNITYRNTTNTTCMIRECLKGTSFGFVVGAIGIYFVIPVVIINIINEYFPNCHIIYKRQQN